MKNKFLYLLLATSTMIGVYACNKSFLDVTPQGVLDEATLASEKGVNKLLLSAYAMLDGHDGGLGLGGEWGSSGSNYLYGSMGAGEANKGSDPGDQGPNMTPVIRHDITAVNGATNDRWKALYEGVKRSNTVIQVLAKVSGISATSQKNLAGQARFLRAWYHFQARIMYGKVPYLDEKIDADLSSGAIAGVTNQTDIYPQIVADAKFAYENLPEINKERAIGRINKWAAGALYGKILMFTKDFATAKTVLTDVVSNGKNSLGTKYALNANFADNFNTDFDNSKESVFAFQTSSNDNAGGRNGNWGDNLNTPAAGGMGGAGFFCPTHFFVNNFKTDADGLPLANPQTTAVIEPDGAAGYTKYAGTLDPRLDWTIGRNGVAFHDWGFAQSTWKRDISCGPFLAKKTVIRQAQVASTHDASLWFATGGVALNMNLIRFSDVILLAAEAEIEVGSLENARTLINMVRTRASNTPAVNVDPLSGSTTTINAKTYTTAFANQAAARTAVRTERLLELGLEGHRFFDLVRWGTSTTEINAYYNYESVFPYQVILKPKPTYAASSDYYPVPQQQIDLGKGFIKP